jgi:ATP-dependent Clp protease ATP-binding subunit ClpC
MFERFTDKARRILVVSQEEARELDHNFLGTEHIMLAMLHEEDTIPHDVLVTMGADYEQAQKLVRAAVPATGASGQAPFTPRAKKVLELSLREALQLGHNWIGPEHMILALVREGDGIGVAVLEQMGLDWGVIRQGVIEEVGKKLPRMPAARTVTLPHDEAKELREWILRFGGLVNPLPHALDAVLRRLNNL